MRSKFIAATLAIVSVVLFSRPSQAQSCNCFEGKCILGKNTATDKVIETVKGFGKVSTFDQHFPELGHNIPRLYDMCKNLVEGVLRSEWENLTPEQRQQFSPPNFITVVNDESSEGGSSLRMATRENSCRQKCE